MRLRLPALVAMFALSSIPLAAGCNAVLGNHEAQLFEAEASVPDASELADTALPPTPVLDAAIDDVAVAPDTAVDDAGTPSCGPGMKTCFGACVSVTDPVYGCGPDSCAPCSLTRATASCAGGACSIAACNAGYSDCDQNPANGCETDLSEVSHCGSCNAKCGVTAPLCAPSGGSFSCTSGCTGQAPTLCGNQCVDLTNSRTHCGQCSNTCPAVANAQVACASSACQFTCATGFHACSNACVSNTDPNTCGGSCTPCAAPANAVATCSTQGECGFSCMPGFHKCGAQCVSNTAVATCGNSCSACAAPPSGTATCGGSPAACGFTCDAAHHACGPVCAANDDVANCGATCGVPCTAGPNATPGCDGTQCTSTCVGTFKDCDPAVPGCESDSSSDPLNCGGCNISCNGQPCMGGVCSTPVPDAGAD